MNKAELVAKMALKGEMTKKDAEKSVKNFMEIVAETLENGDKVRLVGFGTFETKDRKGRTGVNPQDTTKKIKIPAKTVPVFKAGKPLKARVNKKAEHKKGKK